VPCLFNPETISVGSRNNWAARTRLPGERALPKLRYTGADFRLECASTSNRHEQRRTRSENTPGRESRTDGGGQENLPRLEKRVGTTTRARHGHVPLGRDLPLVQVVVPSLSADLAVTFTVLLSSGVPLARDRKMRMSCGQYDESPGLSDRRKPDVGHPQPQRVNACSPARARPPQRRRYYGDSTPLAHLAKTNGIEGSAGYQTRLLLSVPLWTGSEHRGSALMTPNLKVEGESPRGQLAPAIRVSARVERGRARRRATLAVQRCPDLLASAQRHVALGKQVTISPRCRKRGSCSTNRHGGNLEHRSNAHQELVVVIDGRMPTSLTLAAAGQSTYPQSHYTNVISRLLAGTA